MQDQVTIGLARMHYEFGEKRDFLPSFVSKLGQTNVKIFLEFGYGSGMGYTEQDYLDTGQDITFKSHEEILAQEYVLVLRCPNEDELRLLKPGACIVSMMHFPTRPKRVALLRSLGVDSISLDSIKDDVGRRLVENLRSVAWNGMEVGFRVLHRTYPSPGVESPLRAPIEVTVMGVGAVGMHAVQAASRYGDNQLWQSMAQRGVPGIKVNAIEYDLTCDEAFMKGILSNTDILVDATQRPDASQPVIPNEWIAYLPEHAVLVDLSVDPYDCSEDNREVKGIEGIPQGNLDQFVFSPDDPAFDRIPACVTTINRRFSVSCYSWPGFHPKECMILYGKQISPLIRTLINKGGVRNIHPKGKFFERAIFRGLLLHDETI